MTTFNWTISAVERAVSLNGLSDVIQIIHWRYRGTDGNGISAEIYGATSLEDPDPENFKPYTEVTSSDVEGWLESIYATANEERETPSLTQMRGNLRDQIELLINPITITGPLYNSSTSTI